MHFLYEYERLPAIYVGKDSLSKTSSWTNPSTRHNNFHKTKYNVETLTHRIHGTGIFAYIWLSVMVNVCKYTIHGYWGWVFPILLKDCASSEFRMRKDSWVVGTTQRISLCVWWFTISTGYCFAGLGPWTICIAYMFFLPQFDMHMFNMYNIYGFIYVWILCRHFFFSSMVLPLSNPIAGDYQNSRH